MNDSGQRVVAARRWTENVERKQDYTRKTDSKGLGTRSLGLPRPRCSGESSLAQSASPSVGGSLCKDFFA